MEKSQKKSVLRKSVRGLWLGTLALFIVFLNMGSVWMSAVAATSAPRCTQEAVNYIQNAINQNPVLAGNNQYAQAYMGIIWVESKFNTYQGASYNGSSFGISQINYYSHQADINAMVLRGTGQDISGLSFNQRKAIAGQYLQNHPQEAANYGAKIFQQNLATCGGNLNCAIAAYCGCPTQDPLYLAKVLAAMGANLAAGCVAELGNGDIVIYSPQPTDYVAPLNCPAPDLTGGLQEAALAFSHTGTGSGTGPANLSEALYAATAAHALAANLSAQAVAEQNPFRDLSACLDLFNGAFSLIDLLLAPLNLIYTAIAGLVVSIITQACQAVMTTIQNLLNMVCIPLPPFDFGLSKVFGVEGKPCNGLSLGNIMNGLGGFGSAGGGMSPWDLSTLNNYSPQAMAREIARGRVDPVTGQVRR